MPFRGTEILLYFDVNSHQFRLTGACSSEKSLNVRLCQLRKPNLCRWRTVQQVAHVHQHMAVTPVRYAMMGIVAPGMASFWNSQGKCDSRSYYASWPRKEIDRLGASSKYGLINPNHRLDIIYVASNLVMSSTCATHFRYRQGMHRKRTHAPTKMAKDNKGGSLMPTHPTPEGLSLPGWPEVVEVGPAPQQRQHRCNLSTKRTLIS